MVDLAYSFYHFHQNRQNIIYVFMQTDTLNLKYLKRKF